MAWKIETVESRCVLDQSWFRKEGEDGEKLRFSQDVVYRWGYIIVKNDPRAAIVAAHGRGEPLEVSALVEINHSYDDGVSEELTGVEDLPEEEQELLDDASDPEDAGWDSADSKTFFRRTLRITEVAEESPYEPIAGGVGPVDFDPTRADEVG